MIFSVAKTKLIHIRNNNTQIFFHFVWPSKTIFLFSLFIFKGILDQQELLEGPNGLENARFGSAIAMLSDVDLDGFNDVIIGAPLEHQNAGAIYIYNGNQKTLCTKYSQVIYFVKYYYIPSLMFQYDNWARFKMED